eukprot:Rhum_TRINITY_DN12856_c0_g1::Rhum_TRINITY_DN12856_c0_g1_i1::g.54954::m.54954
MTASSSIASVTATPSPEVSSAPSSHHQPARPNGDSASTPRSLSAAAAPSAAAAAAEATGLMSPKAPLPKHRSLYSNGSAATPLAGDRRRRMQTRMFDALSKNSKQPLAANATAFVRQNTFHSRGALPDASAATTAPAPAPTPPAPAPAPAPPAAGDATALGAPSASPVLPTREPTVTINPNAEEVVSRPATSPMSLSCTLGGWTFENKHQTAAPRSASIAYTESVLSPVTSCATFTGATPKTCAETEVPMVSLEEAASTCEKAAGNARLSAAAPPASCLNYFAGAQVTHSFSASVIAPDGALAVTLNVPAACEDKQPDNRDDTPPVHGRNPLEDRSSSAAAAAEAAAAAAAADFLRSSLLGQPRRCHSHRGWVRGAALRWAASESATATPEGMPACGCREHSGGLLRVALCFVAVAAVAALFGSVAFYVVGGGGDSSLVLMAASGCVPLLCLLYWSELDRQCWAWMWEKKTVEGAQTALAVHFDALDASRRDSDGTRSSKGGGCGDNSDDDGGGNAAAPVRPSPPQPQRVPTTHTDDAVSTIALSPPGSPHRGRGRGRGGAGGPTAASVVSPLSRLRPTLQLGLCGSESGVDIGILSFKTPAPPGWTREEAALGASWSYCLHRLSFVGHGAWCAVGLVPAAAAHGAWKAYAFSAGAPRGAAFVDAFAALAIILAYVGWAFEGLYPGNRLVTLAALCAVYAAA